MRTLTYSGWPSRMAPQPSAARSWSMEARRRPRWLIAPVPAVSSRKSCSLRAWLSSCAVLTSPLQYLPRCVLAAIVFTIAIGMVDVPTLRAMRLESPGEFKLAVVTAAAVAIIGVEQGVLLAITLSLLRHVRQSYRPHTAVLQFDPAHGWTTVPATPGNQTEPGLILYRFGADLFYANATRFADEARALVGGAPRPVRWLVIEADAITNLDYTAARVVLLLIDELARQKVGVAFARVSASLRADMDRHGVTAAVGSDRLFVSRHEALAAVRSPT